LGNRCSSRLPTDFEVGECGLVPEVLGHDRVGTRRELVEAVAIEGAQALGAGAVGDGARPKVAVSQ